MNEKELVLRVAFLVLGGLGLALLAKRKNPSPWPWGIVGALCGAVAPLLLLPPLLVLGFLKYKCPKCGAACRTSKRDRVSAQRVPLRS
jgi:hypothetical protein